MKIPESELGSYGIKHKTTKNGVSLIFPNGMKVEVQTKKPRKRS